MNIERFDANLKRLQLRPRDFNFHRRRGVFREHRRRSQHRPGRGIIVEGIANELGHRREKEFGVLNAVNSSLSRGTLASVYSLLVFLLVLVIHADIQRLVDVVDGIEIPARRHDGVGPFPHRRF